MQTMRGDISWKPRNRHEGDPARRPPRPAESYRGARRNGDRLSLRSLLLKEERELKGETRSEADRRREDARRQRLGIAS